MERIELYTNAIQQTGQILASQEGVDGRLIRATSALMLSEAEGIGGGAGTIGEAAQQALPTGIVEVLFLVGTAGIPLREMIQQIVGQCGSGAAKGAAGHIAEGVVAAGITRPTLGRAGRTGGVESRQLVWLSTTSPTSSASTATPPTGPHRQHRPYPQRIPLREDPSQTYDLAGSDGSVKELDALCGASSSYNESFTLTCILPTTLQNSHPVPQLVYARYGRRQSGSFPLLR